MIRCPICGAKSYKKFTKTNIFGKYHFYKCKKCNLLFVGNLPTKKNLGIFYSKYFSLPKNQNLKNLKKFSFVFNKINISTKRYSKLKFLDIGSGSGEIASFLLNKNIEEIACVDFSEDLLKIKKKIKNKKLKIIIGDFLNIENKLKDNYFDIVTLFDVVEHLVNPKIYLNLAIKKLKSGGKLIITTPNINSLNYLIYKKYWDWISPPWHLFYFSPDSISYLMRKLGMYKIQTYSFYGDWEESLIFSLIKLPFEIIKYSLKILILYFLNNHIILSEKKVKKLNIISTKNYSIDKYYFSIQNMLKKIDRLLYSELTYPHLLVICEKK